NGSPSKVNGSPSRANGSPSKVNGSPSKVNGSPSEAGYETAGGCGSAYNCMRDSHDAYKTAGG
ncbi:MAG: hypothetical protein LBD24_08665, partial [Spirochaetaceae bacterium]|nr:hypothetical protein [Spirochaetaceae bacterium]